MKIEIEIRPAGSNGQTKARYRTVHDDGAKVGSWRYIAVRDARAAIEDKVYFIGRMPYAVITGEQR